MKIRPRLRQPGQAGGAETMKKPTTSAKSPAKRRFFRFEIPEAKSGRGLPRQFPSSLALPGAALAIAPPPAFAALPASRGRPGRTPRAGAGSGGGRGRSAGRAGPAAARRLARYTMGLSPTSLWLAYADWASHCWRRRPKPQLAQKGFRKPCGLRLCAHRPDQPKRRIPASSRCRRIA